MPLSCPQCAAQMPETAAFCPGCGESMQVAPRAQGKVGILPVKVAGALAYFTFIPAIVLLLVRPYAKNQFVRFHSFQCLFLSVAVFLAGVMVRFLSLLLFVIPVVGHLLAFLTAAVVGLAAFVIWVVLMVKAFQGEAFKLPVIGDFAEQQAGGPVD